MTDIKIKVSKDKELWEVWGKNDDNPDTLLKGLSVILRGAGFELREDSFAWKKVS
jgi:hypothetical protein